MILVLILAVTLVVGGMAVVGYRMGPPPGGRALTERDRRLQTERADQAAFRSRANPNLRKDRTETVAALAAAAVRMARESIEAEPLLNETEALAEALSHLDQLEREATGVSLGPLVPQIAVALVAVGVLDRFNLKSPELSGLTPDDFTASPGLAIRVAGVADLYVWPRDV